MIVEDKYGRPWTKDVDGLWSIEGAPASSVLHTHELESMYGPLTHRKQSAEEILAALQEASDAMSARVDAAYDSPKVHVISIEGTPVEAHTTSTAAMRRANMLAAKTKSSASLKTLEIY